MLNCGATEIGLNCLESCTCDGTAETTVEAVGGLEPGAGSDVAIPENVADGAVAASELPAAPGGPFRDRNGEFLTHLGTLRRSRWLNLDNAKEKWALNCGATEIRLSYP